MNFKESSNLLNKIKLANKFILNPHRGPDLDSVAAVAAMSIVLTKLGKSVDIYCVEQIPSVYKFVREVSDTNVGDLSKIDLKKIRLLGGA